MSAEKLAAASGVYHIGIAIFHLAFWRLFGWHTALRKLDRVNAAIMQVLNLRLTWLFLVFATIALVYPGELVATPIGKGLLTGITLFWLMRAVEQIIFFGLRQRASQAFFLVCVAGAALHSAMLLA